MPLFAYLDPVPRRPHIESKQEPAINWRWRSRRSCWQQSAGGHCEV